MKSNQTTKIYLFNLLFFTALIALSSCSNTKPNDKNQFEPFIGTWKDIIQNTERPNDYSLRTFYYNADSIFSMVQLEFGTKSRFWTNAGKLSVKQSILYWDEFSAELISEDTLIVNYHDPSGNILPFTLIKSNSEEGNQIMQQLITSKNLEYNYSVPPNEVDGWETSNLESVDIDTSLIYDLINNTKLGEYKDIHSLLIIKDGKIVLDEYFASKGKYSGEIVNHIFRSRPHHLASVTKPITSILMGIALKEGYVSSIDNSVSQYFPEYASLFVGGKQDIQIKHLLTMSTGLSWDQFSYPFQDSRNDAGNMYRCKDVVENYFSKPIIRKPGINLNYSNAAATTCGSLIENASGYSIEEFSNEFLFNPLNITSYYWGKYPEGTYDTDGSLALRARDLAKIGQLVLDNGKWKEKEILDDDWITLSTKKHLSRTDNIDYGFYWQQTYIQYNNKKIRTIFGWGDGGQFLFIFPEINTIIVSNAGNYGKGEDSVIFDMLKEYILPSISN